LRNGFKASRHSEREQEEDLIKIAENKNTHTKEMIVFCYSGTQNKLKEYIY